MLIWTFGNASCVYEAITITYTKSPMTYMSSCQVICHWPSRGSVIIKSIFTSHKGSNVTWAHRIMHPLPTSRECLCTMCLLQYNMHGGGGAIVGAV